MPVYDYKCKDHGVFHDLATFEESDKPADCPTCGGVSPRIIMVAPSVLGLDRNTRQAHERNEKARHEPMQSSSRADHVHNEGCGCGENTRRNSNLFFTAEGNKSFPSMRPWMISH